MHITGERILCSRDPGEMVKCLQDLSRNFQASALTANSVYEH